MALSTKHFTVYKVYSYQPWAADILHLAHEQSKHVGLMGFVAQNMIHTHVFGIQTL